MNLAGVCGGVAVACAAGFVESGYWHLKGALLLDGPSDPRREKDSGQGLCLW